jgi:outer membrane protein assembly factor BamB
MRHILFRTVLAVSIAGCGSLKVDHPPAKRAGDWPTLGGSEARTGVSTQAVIPPLQLEWEQDVSAGIGTGSPVLVDSILLLGNLRGELVALHAASGRKLGAISMGDAVMSSPVVDGATVYVTAANTRESLVAYDLVEGKPRWRGEYGDIEVSPLLHNGRLFAGTTSGVFVCVDALTGDSVWTRRIEDNVRRKGIRSTAAAAGGLVVFGADDGFVRAVDALRGTLRWSTATGAAVVAAAAIDGGHVFIANLDGKACALDTADGRVLWTFETGSAVYATALATDSLVIFGTTGGTLFGLDKAGGTQRWRADAGGPVSASAVASGEHLYVGTLRRELLAMRLADGTVTWKADMAGRIKSAPAIAYGRIYVACDDRMVRAFKEAR